MSLPDDPHLPDLPDDTHLMDGAHLAHLTDGAHLALPSSPLRVAAAQATAVPGDIAANARGAAALTARAAGEGARVVVLPELHLCGYDLTTLAAHPDRCEVSADERGTVADPRLDVLAGAAGSHAVSVLGGGA